MIFVIPSTLVSKLSARSRERLILALIASFIIGVGCSTIYRAGFDVKIRTDLSVYRAAGVGALAGSDLYKIKNERTWFFTSPPIVAILCIPLAWTPLVWDALIVYIVSILILAATCFLARALIPPELSKERTKIVLSTFAFSSIYFMDVLTRGQFGILVLFFLTLTLYGWLNRRHTLSGWALGFAIAIKITPAALLLVYFLLKREFRILAWAVASLITFSILVPGIYFGFGENLGYLATWTKRIPLSVYNIPPDWDTFYDPLFSFWRQIHDPFIYRNQSWYAVWTRLLLKSRELMVAQGIGLPRLLAWGSSLSMLIVSLISWRKKRDDTCGQMLEFSTAIMVLLVSTTLAWTHYFSAMFIPYLSTIICFYTADLKTRKVLQRGFTLSIVAMVTGYAIPLIRAWGGLLWSVVLLWGCFIWLLKQPKGN